MVHNKYDLTDSKWFGILISSLKRVGNKNKKKGSVMNKQIKINLNGVEVMATVTQEEYDKAYPKVRKYGRVERGESYYTSEFSDAPEYQDTRGGIDNFNYKTGRYFLTATEAIKDIERQKARMRIIRRIEELNDGWVPDFEDEDEDKFSVHYDHIEDNLTAYPLFEWQEHESCLYMKSQEIAEQMIREHGDDYKLLWGIV